MKKLIFAILISTTFCFNSFAQDKEPIDELFEVMQADKMIDTMYQQMGLMLNNMRQQMNVSADEMEIFEKYNQRMLDVMRKELSWEKMSPDMKQIYKQNFTTAEIQGLVDFYKSPVGQSFTEKMPVITQESMQIGQQMVMGLMPKIQAVSGELQAELSEYRAKK